MSDGYLTPKKTPLQWAASRLSDGAFKTLMVQFSHVNDIGTCYPGYKLLGELTRHELPCIWIEMQEIMALDLVRQIEAPKRDEYGRWSNALYQVNPDFLYIRPDRLQDAIALWKSVEQTIEQKVPANFPPSIVPLESAESAIAISSRESAPGISSRNQQQQSAFSLKTPENGMSAGQTQRAAPHEEQESAPDQEREARNSAVRRTENPPVPASPPRYEKLTPIGEQLPPDDETLALRIRQDAKVPLKISRALVIRFGYGRVSNALETDFVKNGKKPGGALRHILEQQQLESDEQLTSRRAGIIS